MLEYEHCELNDDNDPHGERRFKRACIEEYNKMMQERGKAAPMPGYPRDTP